MSFSDFSSWPRDQEQSFVVYEQHNTESMKKAVTLGTIAGLIFLVVTVGIYAGVEPDRRDLSKDMNMSNLSKKSRAATPAPTPAPAPAAAPAEPPKTETPAAAPAAPAEEKK
jgi:hypothetical protein